MTARITSVILAHFRTYIRRIEEETKRPYWKTTGPEQAFKAGFEAGLEHAKILVAMSSTRPLPGKEHTMNSGSRSQWYTYGLADAATHLKNEQDELHIESGRMPEPEDLPEKKFRLPHVATWDNGQQTPCSCELSHNHPIAQTTIDFHDRPWRTNEDDPAGGLPFNPDTGQDASRYE